MQVEYSNYQYGAAGRPFTGSPTLSTMTSNSSPSLNSSIPESDREPTKLTLSTPMIRIAKVMANATSGLEVKDRVWLKMTIPNSFIGSDLVDWLHTHVEGFLDRRHARKYAALMLKHSFIRHTVNKITFSEQCYYVFGDFKAAANSLPSEFQGLTLSDSGDADTIGPLPPGGIWSSDGEYSAPPYDYFNNSGRSHHTGSSKSPSPDNHRHGTGSSGGSSTGASNSHNSSSHGSSNQQQGQPPPQYNSNMNNGSSGGSGYIQPYAPNSRMRHSSSISSSSEFTSVSQQVPGGHFMPPGGILPPQKQSSSRSGSDRESDRVSAHHTGRSGGGAAGERSESGQRELGVAAHLTQSRESFLQALDNSCLVDVI